MFHGYVRFGVFFTSNQILCQSPQSFQSFQSTSAENPMENPPLLQGIWHQHPGDPGDGIDPIRARWAIASQHHDEP